MATAKEIEVFMDTIYKECMSDMLLKDNVRKVDKDNKAEVETIQGDKAVTKCNGLINLFK